MPIQLSRKTTSKIGEYLRDKLADGNDLFEVANEVSEIIEKELQEELKAAPLAKAADVEAPAVEIKPMSVSEKKAEQESSKTKEAKLPGGNRPVRHVGGITDESGKHVGGGMLG